MAKIQNSTKLLTLRPVLTMPDCSTRECLIFQLLNRNKKYKPQKTMAAMKKPNKVLLKLDMSIEYLAQKV